MNNTDKKNTFSIIIPVLNQKKRIDKVLSEVRKQCSDYKFYEIIVVDNGSTDGTLNFLKKYNDIKVLTEHKNRNSPYSARNKGIIYSSHDIIVLLDATCVPSNNWLKNGLQNLKNSSSNIIAGNIIFEISKKNSFSEIYDSLIHVNVKKMVERGTAPTGNLFIERNVFDTIGLFPDKIRSSGDVFWSKKATNHGFKITFSDEAFAYYPPKKFKELVRKRFRIGRGHALVKAPIYKISTVLYLSLKLFKPIKINSIIQSIESRGEAWMINKRFGIWIVSQFITRAFILGKIYGAIINIVNNIFLKKVEGFKWTNTL